jgi:hypothetical protein
MTPSQGGLVPVRFPQVEVQWHGPVPSPWMFRALPSDLAGESVILGPPQFMQQQSYAQILAIIQAHPFDRRFADHKPSVSFTTTKSESRGLTVTSDASWTLSDDCSMQLGLGALSLSTSIHNSYLNSLGNTDDRSVTRSVTRHATFTHADMILVSKLAYNVWRYPVIRYAAKTEPGGEPGKKEAGAELLVIIPDREQYDIDWIQANDYAYRPRSEVGMLLSYIDLPKDGYDEKNQLFDREGYDIPADQDSRSFSCDLSQSTTTTLSTHLNILHSESVHAGVTASTELFEYLPVNFGLSVGTSKSYSQTKAETTHINLHEGLTISAASGSVKDEEFKYHVVPVIYRHDKLGCLMLAWDVSLGEGWKSALVTAPQPCLIRIYPDSKNEIFQTFSRSISFVEHPDGTLDIAAEIFNNSRSSVGKVRCEFFDVSSEFKRLPADTSSFADPSRRLGEAALDRELKPIERRKLWLYGQKLPKPTYIAVKLFMDKMSFGVYWGVYPAQEFLNLRPA